IPIGKVKRTRKIFEIAGSAAPAPNPTPPPEEAASTPPVHPFIGDGPQTPLDNPRAPSIAATSMNLSGQAVSTHLPAKTATPSLDAAANPFLAMSMTLAPGGLDLVPHDDCPASSPLAPLPSGRVSPFQVENSPGILDPARAGTPGPTQTPLTRAELEGFDPLAPTTPITPPAAPQALAFGSREHQLAVIKSEPKAKSLSVTPPTSHPLKSNPSHSMPLPPASTGHPHDGRKATSPSFTPPSPPSYAPASPSTAAVWRTLFGDSASPEPELPPAHNGETARDSSQPPVTTTSNHDSDDDVKDESDGDNAVKSESDEDVSPTNASSPSPTPPPPRYTTARRTGGPLRPLAHPPVPRGSINRPQSPLTTPGQVPKPRTGEDSPPFLTPPTHFPSTPAGAAMPPTRLHAKPAHHTAKSSASTNSTHLGSARTVAFKPAPPSPIMTRSRAHAAMQPTAPPTRPVEPTIVTRSRARTIPIQGPANPSARLAAAIPPTRPTHPEPMSGVQPTHDGAIHGAPKALASPPTSGIKRAPNPRTQPPSTLASTSTAPLAPTMDPYNPFNHDDDRDSDRRHHGQRQAIKEAHQRPLKSTKPRHVRALQQDLEALLRRHVAEVNGDRHSPFATRDAFINAVCTPRLFRGRARALYDANRDAWTTYDSAMRRLATYASDGLTPAESLQRVRRYRWDPRKTAPVTAMTQLQLLGVASGNPVPLSELKHLFVTGCVDRRTARRLQNVRYTVGDLDLPWNDDRVSLELLAQRAQLETAASGHSTHLTTTDDDSGSSSGSTSSSDSSTSESSSSDDDHHRRRRRNRKGKRRASSRRRRQSSSRRRRDHRSPSTDRRRQSRDRRALESGRPSTSRGSTSTAAVDTAYPTQLVEAMETILAMHSPAGYQPGFPAPNRRNLT
ncbi:hypothetical protein HDU96_002884, partial [Phlyctochytrium bullatum]